MYRYRRRAAGSASDRGLYGQDPLPATRRHVQQRPRSAAAAGRTTGRSDLRGHQHARPQRRGVRPHAHRAPDGDLHHGLLRICHRGIPARRRRLPVETFRVLRLQPFGRQGQFALRTAAQPARQRPRTCARGGAQRQGIHLGESRLQGFADQDRRHRLPGERGRVRAHAPGRRFDHHHAVPAQEHGDGAPVRTLHARAPLLHRQPALHPLLRQGAHLSQRHGVRTHRRELQGGVPALHRHQFQESLTAAAPPAASLPGSRSEKRQRQQGSAKPPQTAATEKHNII